MDHQFARRLVHMDPHFTGCIRYWGRFRVARPDYAGRDLIARIEKNELFVFLRNRCRVLRVERAFTLAAAHVGNAHSGQHPALQGFRRKGTGTPQNGAGDASRREGLPQRHAASPVDYSWLGQHILRPLEPGQRNIRQVGFRIATDEVKDAVSARVSAGDKRRPGYRGLCGISRLQAGIATRGANSGEVWELSAFQHGFHNAGLEAVQTDDNNFSAQEADPKLRSSFRTVLGSVNGGRRSGAAEFPHDFENNANDLVPKDQQEAEHTGQPGGHRHHLVGTGVECQQFNSHEYSPDLFFRFNLTPSNWHDLNIAGFLIPSGCFNST